MNELQIYRLGIFVRHETPNPIPTSICEKSFLPYVQIIFGRRG